MGYNSLRHANMDGTSLDHNDFAERVERIVGNVERAVSGKREGVFLAVVAMLAGGHVLIEDVPGVGKTLLAKSLARSLRAALEPLRDGLGRQTFATVRLLVDELVANAERHGTPAPGAPVGLEISCTDDKVRIAVTDTGSGFSPPRRPSEPAGPGGWGLLAVDRLGRRWGVQREPLATVWVEVSR